MALATTVFFVALAGLICLFGFKYWENRRGKMPWSNTRRRIDAHAHRTKEIMLVSVVELEKLPPHLINFMRASVQRGAIAFGYLAHWLGRRSHALADMISHKHRFQRKETNSEFLKKVIEHPMRPENGRVSGVHSASAQHAIQEEISLSPTYDSPEPHATAVPTDIGTTLVEREQTQGKAEEPVSPMAKEQNAPRRARRVRRSKPMPEEQRSEKPSNARKRKDTASLGGNPND